MLTNSDVVEIFHAEYRPLHDRFVVQDLTLDRAPTAEGEEVNKPGVYVFWKSGYGVIKVGKSQSNSRTRALQHIRDNTRNERLEMKMLSRDPDCHLLLFNIRHEEDVHWVLSLEYFLEKKLSPVIPADRSG